MDTWPSLTMLNCLKVPVASHLLLFLKVGVVKSIIRARLSAVVQASLIANYASNRISKFLITLFAACSTHQLCATATT